MDATIPPEVYGDDKRTTVVGSVVFCILFTTVMVGLRIYTRTKIIRSYGVDDYLAVAALLATTGCGIAIALSELIWILSATSGLLTCIAVTTHGLGRHIVLLTPADITEYMKSFYTSIVFYNIALLCIKLSFLCQFYRVMAVPRMRRVYAIALLIVGAWSTSQLFISALQCIPVSGFWDKGVKAKCIPNQPQWYINAAGNIITDVAVFALPMPIFWHLSLPRKQKILLIGIFSLGFFTVAISIVRIRFLNIPADFTWANVDASLWSIGEISSAVTCACLPTLRPLLTKLFPGLMSRVNLSSAPSHQTETRRGLPTRAYSSLPKPRNLEKGTADWGTSGVKSSHLGDDDASIASDPPYQHHANESGETIFGLASVREETVAHMKSNFSPLSSPPMWNLSSSSQSSQVRREGTPF